MREDKSYCLHGNNGGSRHAHGGGDTLVAATITAGNHCERTDQGAYRHESTHRCADHALLHVFSSCACTQTSPKVTLLVTSHLCRKHFGPIIFETQKDRDLAPVKRPLITVEITLL